MIGYAGVLDRLQQSGNQSIHLESIEFWIDFFVLFRRFFQFRLYFPILFDYILDFFEMDKIRVLTFIHNTFAQMQ